MELNRINIKNFRSIKEETISFDHNCKILIGKNEAGKSNVLKAIVAVFGEYKVHNKDKRKRIKNEKIDEYHVRAIFKMTEQDLSLALKSFQNKYTGTELIEFKDNRTIKEFIHEHFKEILKVIVIGDNQEPTYMYWGISENKKEVKNELFIEDNNLVSEKTSENKKFKLDEEIFSILKDQTLNENIKCNYWSYSDDFLIPNTVSIEEFKKEPSYCKSLENIFILCNRENIDKEFTEAYEQDGDYQNLLEQISNETTKVFRSIWKDFGKTSIQLMPDGEKISTKIVDQVKSSFEDRSDGFKKFISILLMLSTRHRKKLLDKNDIILIDEPDQSLYPTSAIYLRDELLKIAEKSTVLYSTHSQYMIDSKTIDRHLVVIKENDITRLEKPSEKSQYSNDELLKNAIGTSIFECLQSMNIIFEGWLDKALFDKYCTFKKDKTFESCGKVYLHGISGTNALIQLLILANKKFIIVADSDQTSMQYRKKFESDYGKYKSNWIAYGDDSEEKTMEDFFDPSYIESIIKEHKPNFKYDSNKNAIKNVEEAFGSNNKEEIRKVKKQLVNNLQEKNILPVYKKFIIKLKKQIS